MAQQKTIISKPTGSQVAVAAQANPTERVAESGNAPTNAAWPPSGRSVFAATRIGSNDITVIDDVATVKAHVSVYDKRQGMAYVWRLRVVDKDVTPLAGRVYQDQIFSIDESRLKDVDFLDHVDVPAGSYRIELVLFGKAPGEDFTFLDDDVKAKGHQMVRIVKLVKN